MQTAEYFVTTVPAQNGEKLAVISKRTGATFSTEIIGGALTIRAESGCRLIGEDGLVKDHIVVDN